MRIFYTYILLFICFSSFGQKKNTKKHSPHKASVYSAILPGAGQVYNKKYWKVPIVYAAIGSAAYFTYDNGIKYKEYRDAFQLRKNGGTDKYDGIYSDNQLITIMNYYERNRELSLIITAAIYILNIVDASVDAHLFNFDVSENLSLISTTKLMETQTGYQPILSLQMNF